MGVFAGDAWPAQCDSAHLALHWCWHVQLHYGRTNRDMAVHVTFACLFCTVRNLQAQFCSKRWHPSLAYVHSIYYYWFKDRKVGLEKHWAMLWLYLKVQSCVCCVTSRSLRPG